MWGAHRPPWCARSLVRAVTKTLRRWHLRYSDLQSWLIFAFFYPSGRSRIPARKIRQYNFIDVKTIIFFVIISFSEVSIPATRCINIRGPALGYSERRRAVAQPVGLVPKHKQWAGPLEVLRSEDSDAHQRACTLYGQDQGRAGPNPWAWYRSTSNGRRAGPAHSQPRPAPATSQELRHQMPTSVHARFRARNGEERGQTQHTHNPAMLPLANPQLHRIHRRLSQGPSSPYRLEIATAPAGFTRPVAKPLARCPPVAYGGSVLTGIQTPTSAHTRFRAGNGEERGCTQHAHNPAMLPLANHQQHRVHRCLSQGPSSHYGLEIATAPAGFTRPLAWCPPVAYGGCVLARRPPARTHALGLGTGKMGGVPSTLITPPCYRSLTPSLIAFTAASVKGPLLVTA